MQVVVLGASGNIGSALLGRLTTDPSHTVIGVARRRPASAGVGGVEWRTADIATSDLRPLVRGADAVVHLAWRIQPSHRLAELHETNVAGSRRVIEAVASEGVPVLVAASSVGAYSPGPKDRRVDESWPVDGVPSSFYARHKAELERTLAGLEARSSSVRVVRLRPALVFQRDAATSIRRLFVGPLVPNAAVSRRVVRVLPDIPGLRFQAVHADDVARTILAALAEESFRGAVNIAAEPVLDMPTIAEAAGARLVPIPARAARAALALLWRARLQVSPPGWLDMALGVPLMDTTRAVAELGVEPRVSALAALRELAAGIHDGAGHPTPPLDPRRSGRLRRRELAAALGDREV